MVFAQRPPRGVAATDWLRQLCATRCSHATVDLTHDRSFFFGRISTKEAIAEVAERGVYLLRLSSVPGSLTLTVGLGGGRAFHHRISRNDVGAFLMRLPKSGREDREEEEDKEFESLWEALQLARLTLDLIKPAGPSRYRRGMPAEEKDPWMESATSKR